MRVDSGVEDAALGPDAGDAQPMMPSELCPMTTESPCAYAPERVFPTLAVAADVRFVAQARGRIVLAELERHDGPAPLLMLERSAQWLQARPYHGAYGYSPMGMVAPEEIWVDHQERIMCRAGAAYCLYLLGCDDNECRLFGVPRGEPLETAIRKVVAPPVPAPIMSRGLGGVFPSIRAPDLLCAFGDGVACFDGTGWTERVPPGSGPPLNGLAVLSSYDATPVLVAAGEEGRLLLVSEDTWTELDAGTGARFLSVAARDGLFVAGGEDGALVMGSAYQFVLDQASEETLVGVTLPYYTDHPEHSVLWALTSGGCVMGIEITRWPLLNVLSTCFYHHKLVGSPLGLFDDDVIMGMCGGASLLSDAYLAYLGIWCAD